MSNFKMGMAKDVISPKLGTLLYGYPSKRHAERVRDDINISVMAFEEGDKKLLLVSTELVSVQPSICLEIREAIAKETGIKRENILYSSIHTHSGPSTRNSVGWGEANMEYINNILILKSIETSKKAIANLKPAKMGLATVDTLTGINRREVTPDGKVILGQNPQGPYDPTMTVVLFKSLDDENLGSFVHFAAHPTVAGANRSISRDWPGHMIDRIEKLTGAYCMFLNGAEGDVGPRISNGRTTADESYIEEVGTVAASDAEKGLKLIKGFKIPSMQIITGKISFPLVNPPSLDEVEKEIEKLGDPDKLVAVDITKYSQYSKMKNIYLSGGEFEKTWDFDQTVVSIGDLAFVPAPFEAFCEISLKIKEKSPFKNTILVGLTGGSNGYLPTEEQMQYGGYEVDSFHAAHIPSFDNSSDKVYISKCVELLNNLNN